MGKYDYNANEKFDTFYLTKIQPTLKHYNLSLQCLRDFVVTIKWRNLNDMQNIFKHLNNSQKYALLSIHIDTGTDCLFETNLQWFPPYGNALKVAKEYGCSNLIINFLRSQMNDLTQLQQSHSKEGISDFFKKVELPTDTNLDTSSYTNRKDAAPSVDTKLEDSTEGEEQKNATTSKK